MSEDLNYTNYIKRETLKEKPQFIKYNKGNKTTPEHNILFIKAYGDAVTFKYPLNISSVELADEVLRLHEIFNTTNPIYNGTHPFNKRVELLLFKRRNFKRNHIYNIGEWNFYELDYLLK